MLNQVSEPVQPIRSAITVAGISGCSDKIERTLALNGANAVATALRTCLAGRSDATASGWHLLAHLRVSAHLRGGLADPCESSRLWLAFFCLRFAFLDTLSLHKAQRNYSAVSSPTDCSTKP